MPHGSAGTPPLLIITIAVHTNKLIVLELVLHVFQRWPGKMYTNQSGLIRAIGLERSTLVQRKLWNGPGPSLIVRV